MKLTHSFVFEYLASLFLEASPFLYRRCSARYGQKVIAFLLSARIKVGRTKHPHDVVSRISSQTNSSGKTINRRDLPPSTCTSRDESLTAESVGGWATE